MIYIFRSQQRVWGSSLQSERAAWKSGKWLKELKTFLSINYQCLLSKVEMRCHPPRGKPLPSISWMKDGQELDIVNDPNYLTAADGHLIIIQVVFSIKPFFFFKLIEFFRFAPRTFLTTAVWLRTWSIDGSAPRPGWRLWVSYLLSASCLKRIIPLC